MRLSSQWCLVVSFCWFLSYSVFGVSGGVKFDDSHLKSIIEQTLKIKDPNAKDMLELVALEVPRGTVTSLNGLESACNLKELNIENNSISSLEPLKNLTRLVDLNISGCGIDDVHVLANLKSLKILRACRNAVADLSFLKDMVSLEWLDLSDNDIIQIGPLKNLPNLRRLSLDNNRIRDISALAKLYQLKILSCYANRIQDISSLSEFYEIEALQLDRNEIADIGALAKMQKLKYLWLSGNKIEDVTPLQQLVNLEMLELGNNSLEDISSLSSLTKLRRLGLQNNRITDITSVTDLEKIETVNLNGNPLDQDSRDLFLPYLFIKNMDTINIYWLGMKYETDDRDLTGEEPIQYSIGPYAAISPDERYLTIVIGPRQLSLPLPDETASVYVFDTQEKNKKLSPVPNTAGGLFNGEVYSMAWRPCRASHELFVFTDSYFYSCETPCLKGFTIASDGVARQIYSRSFYSSRFQGITNLRWRLDGRILSGIYEDQLVLLDPDKNQLTRHNISGIDRLLWSEEGVLYSRTDSCIFKSKILQSGLVEQGEFRAVQAKGHFGGIVNNKLVYSAGNQIYYDKELIYSANDIIQELFANTTYIAFRQGKSICVIDFQGVIKSQKDMTGKMRLIAFAPDSGDLYVLCDYKRIEKYNAKDFNEHSLVIDVASLYPGQR
ncbi:MAG TPA: leucine-rich repeat domain-containing protein [Anaerohalosphaeraceae bacterium]|nr:leucine-rich repeat domain-containing protein [Anaerohalosphaeraceae bacterium]